jgi:hypothetical protein
MTAALGETMNGVTCDELSIATLERMRIAAILAGQQAVIVTVHGKVAYEPRIAGQGRPFANWAQSELWYEVTVNGETLPQ